MGRQETITRAEFDALRVDVAATKLLNRVLIQHLLVDDPQESEAAIGQIMSKVEATLSGATVGLKPLAKTDPFLAAVRRNALNLLAGLLPERPRQ